MPNKKPTNPDDDRSLANRLVIPLNQDNSIDWESTRESMKNQLLSIVNNDVTILEHIGMSHESGENDLEGMSGSDLEGEITTANVAAFLDGLTKTNALFVSMIIPRVLAHPIKSRMEGKRVPLNIDKDIALANFSLTPEQHKELDPRAERLARKYMPASARKHLDVIMLGSMYLNYMTLNIKNTIEAQLKKDLKEIMQGGTSTAPPQAPIDTDKPSPVNGHAPEAKFNEEVIAESFEPGHEPEPGV